MTDAYNPATRPCAPGAQPGCTALQHTILRFWPAATNLGTFICRPTADGDPSVHGDGRAGDIGPGLDPCAQVADWLIANHTILGVQLVIWNHRIWNVTKQAQGWRPYGCDVAGSKKDHHTGHVHWEINVDAAKRLTPAIIDTVRPHQTPQPQPPEEDMRPVPYRTREDDGSNVSGAIYLTSDFTTTRTLSEPAWIHGGNLGWWPKAEPMQIPVALHNWMRDNSKGQNIPA